MHRTAVTIAMAAFNDELELEEPPDAVLGGDRGAELDGLGLGLAAGLGLGCGSSAFFTYKSAGELISGPSAYLSQPFVLKATLLGSAAHAAMIAETVQGWHASSMSQPGESVWE